MTPQLPPAPQPSQTSAVRSRRHASRRPSNHVPPLAGLILRVLLPRRDREFFLGDLVESQRRLGPREMLAALYLRMAPTSVPRTDPLPKGDGMLRELFVDLRYGVRTMLRTPGFALVALLTMALGIGANTAMFSIFHGVVLKPFPYPASDRIVILRENNLSMGFSSFSMAPLNFWDWQKRNRSTELIAAYQQVSVNYTGGDRPESLSAYRASESFLEILGGRPVRGRGITKEDLDPKSEAVVVLTHGYWQRAFGGGPDVLGRTMVLDGVVSEVVGVLPQGWLPLSRTGIDVVLPLKPEPFWHSARGAHFLVGLGRLKPGVTVEQARADFSSIATALQAEYPDSNKGWGAVVRSFEDVALGSIRPQLLIFMGVVGLVLIVACANLANMTLARATVRGRELAIRTAVGAARGRVVRQLLAESVLLSTVAGALGLVLAAVVLKGFVAGWPTLLPRMREIGIDTSVLLFSLGLSLASGVIFGLVPAISVTGPNLLGTLRGAGHAVAGGRSHRWMRAGLVVAELGMAACLLVGTGLLVRSFATLQAEDPGFRVADRLVLSTPLPEATYATAVAIRTYADAALTRLAALPGVKSAALTSLVPLGGRDELWGFWLEGRVAPGGQQDGSALIYRVSPGYFETTGGLPIADGIGIVALVGAGLGALFNARPAKTWRG